MKTFEFLDPTRATLLIALAVGMGVAVHEMFFVVAFVIAIIAVIQCAFRATTFAATARFLSVFLLLWGCSYLHASHLKSDNASRIDGSENARPFGEVDQQG